jgi:type IV pilus assembly protein PilW
MNATRRFGLPQHSATRAVRGMSLIELLVAIVIASLLSLAMFGVLASFEGRKRTTTSLNDSTQAGNYAIYLLDRWVRSAGSGFTQVGGNPLDKEDRTAMAFGCKLLAARSGTTVLPMASTPPAPFDNVNTGAAGVFRLLPLLIAPQQSGGTGFGGQRSDVLVMMAGTAGFGEVPLNMTAASTASALSLRNSVTVAGNDILLLADQPSPTLIRDCMVQQVQAPFAGSAASAVTLGGTYAASTIGTALLAGKYGSASAAVTLGNEVGGNPPRFLLIGVGANATLMSYDMLQATQPALQAMADSVYEMHAVYGVSRTSVTGQLDDWHDPSATGSPYAMSALMTADISAVELITQIKAVRVALVLRTQLQEKDAVSPPTLTVFGQVQNAGGTSLARTRTLTADEQRYRYRVVEMTIPLRNSLLIQ